MVSKKLYRNTLKDVPGILILPFSLAAASSVPLVRPSDERRCACAVCDPRLCASAGYAPRVCGPRVCVSRVVCYFCKSALLFQQ